MDWAQLIGWGGSACIIAAYTAITVGLLGGESRAYLLLNLVGSVVILLVSLDLNAASPLLLNGAFALFSLMALLSIRIPKVSGGTIILWTIAVSAGATSLFMSGEALDSLGFMAVTVLILGFVLFSQGQMPEVHFLLNNLFANAMYAGILISTANWPSLGIVAFASGMTVYGLVKRLVISRPQLV